MHSGVQATWAMPPPAVLFLQTRLPPQYSVLPGWVHFYCNYRFTIPATCTSSAFPLPTDTTNSTLHSGSVLLHSSMVFLLPFYVLPMFGDFWLVSTTTSAFLEQISFLMLILLLLGPSIFYSFWAWSVHSTSTVFYWAEHSTCTDGCVDYLGVRSVPRSYHH